MMYDQALNKHLVSQETLRSFFTIFLLFALNRKRNGNGTSKETERETVKKRIENGKESVNNGK